MTTYLLPGFSIKNKEWAEETQKELASLDIKIIYWSHWQTGQTEPNWLNNEAQKISQLIGNQPVNLLAKSIGTLVAMLILAKNPQIEKIILCGTCLTDFQPGNAQLFQILKTFPANKLLCLQNEFDPHGSLLEAQNFFAHINPAIKVVSPATPLLAATHDYPSFEDFRIFLI